MAMQQNVQACFVTNRSLSYGEVAPEGAKPCLTVGGVSGSERNLRAARLPTTVHGFGDAEQELALLRPQVALPCSRFTDRELYISI